MVPGDPDSTHIEPSFFVKAFSIGGAFIAVGAAAMLATVVLVAANKWYRFEYSIFGLAWGICARLFELSVRRGIKQSYASSYLTTKKRKMLSEQLTMLWVTRWFVRAELAASGILLLVELLTH